MVTVELYHEAWPENAVMNTVVHALQFNIMNHASGS